MNIGIILLGLMLVAGSVLGIIMIGAGANQPVVPDTFGDLQSNQTNETRDTVTNTTGSLMAAGGGLVMVIAVILLFFIAMVLIGTVSKSSFGGRR